VKRAGVLALAVLLVSARAAADEPAGPAPGVRPPAPVESRFSLKVALGGDYRSLYGVPIYGGDAHLSIGAEMGLYAVYGTAGLTLGTTQYGLGTTIIDLGCSFERRFDRFTLGLPLRPSYLRIARATTGGALDSVGIGIAPFVGFDLVSSEGHTLFLAASLNLDEYLVGSTAFAWGPSLSIGYRETD
jgi:Ca2+/Na+ antiporter